MVLSVFVGRIAYTFFKQSAEVLGVFESEFVGNFAYRLACVKDSFLGYFDQVELDVLLG